MIFFLLRIITGSRNHHGLHIADLPQFIFRVFQLQLQLFHIQPLAFQGKVRQRSIKGHQQIAFFYYISLCHQNFRNCLGIRHKDRLDSVGGDGAIAFLIVPPIFCHTNIGKGKYIHRLFPAVLCKIPTAKACACHDPHSQQNNQ